MAIENTATDDRYHLIFDPSTPADEIKKILSSGQEIISSHEPFDPPKIAGIAGGSSILCYLSDEQLRSIVPKINGTAKRVAFLPHPDAHDACVALGIDRSVDKALDFLKKNPPCLKMDLLYCNGAPVFNNIVAGQTFRLTSENGNATGLGKILSFVRFFRIRPFKVDIELHNDKRIRTSVAGLIVSEHRKASLVTRLAMEGSSVNDGKMHAFFLSPRSVMEMLQYGIRSLWRRRRLPPFAAFVRTSQLTITFPSGPRDFLIDGKLNNAQVIELCVAKGALNMIPGSKFESPVAGGDTADVVKVAPLPLGEAAKVLAEEKLPLIRKASSEEFRELFQVLRTNARLKNSYLMLMVLSTVLATFGLFANSSPVVIGAMILAPLMSPIISLSMGTLRHDRQLIEDAVKTICAGLGLSLIFAVGITLLTPIQAPGSEMLARTRPNLLDLGIAVVSGIAGAYAHAREEIAKTLAGVAIAVALIPPFSVAAIGIGWANPSVFTGALLLFSTNLAGMVLAAGVTFMLLGFSPLKFATRGILISLAVVIILSVPLALGFNQMVEEHRIKKQIENMVIENAVIKDVHVQSISPMKISVRIVSQAPLSDAEIDHINMEVENQLQRRTEIEMIMAITR